MTGREPQESSLAAAGTPREVRGAGERSGRVLVRAQNVGKKYRIYTSPYLRLIEWTMPGGRKLHRDFWALRDVSLELSSGDRLGVLGMNGAGKSTLLALLTGILSPDEGRVETTGDVASLLDLAAGFHREFTGRENVFLAGQLRGLTRRRMSDYLEAIIAFAEIGEFIDQPVRTYSSGMLMRLAFSVATMVKPDVLIVDEVISVGDAFFQHKCRQRMKELTAGGTALLLVSHSTDQIRSMCNRGLVLDRGRPVFLGSSERAADIYLKHIRERAAASAQSAAGAALSAVAARPAGKEAESAAAGAEPYRARGFPPAHAFGYGPADAAEIVNVEVVDGTGAKADSFGINEDVTLRICAYVKGPVENFGAAFLVRDKAGVDLLGVTSHHYGCTIRQPSAGEAMVFTFTFANVLREGHYSISAAINRLADPANPRSGLIIHQYDNVAGYRSRGLPDLDVYCRVYVPVQVSVEAGEPASR
jgi:lipopolysaccharide transport system ATP-binding protein